MGLAYSVVQFRDVMIRSLKNPLELGTNHSDELRLLLKSCTRIANGMAYDYLVAFTSWITQAMQRLLTQCSTNHF